MTEREQFIEQHLRVIRSFALILTKDNWRDVDTHIRIQFDALKEFANGEPVEK